MKLLPKEIDGKEFMATEPLNRPQEPIPPYPYAVEQVSYTNPKAGISLSATLTLPASKTPCPVALLIAGSGPCDRDESVAGHKPFLVVSDYLTRQGIAVLRVDKRGCGKSTGNYAQATTQEFASDVLSGINYLKSRKEINVNQIGLIGHSEGGIIAPIVASQSKDVAFIVLMAAPAVKGEEIMYEQVTLTNEANGESADGIAQIHAFQEQVFAVLKKEANLEIAGRQLRQLAENHLDGLQKAQNKITLDLLEAQINFMNTPWFRYFLSFELSLTLKQVKIPVLALNGQKDVQVSFTQNLPVIAQALQDGGNTDVTIVELPNLNHLFQTCQKGTFDEYKRIEETISPSVLELIAQWILKRA